MTIKDIIDDHNLLNQQETIDFIVNLSMFDIIKLSYHLTDREMIKIFNNQKIYDMNVNTFNSLFLKSSIIVQKEILHNESLFNKVMNIPDSKLKKSIFEIVNEELLFDILNSKYATAYFDKINNFINKIDNTLYQKISNHTRIAEIYKENSRYHSLEELEEHLNQIYKNKEIIKKFIIKCQNNILNPLDIIRISNEKEFILYTKFNVLVKIDSNQNHFTLNNGIVLNEDYILKINEKQVNILLNKLREKSANNDTELLVSVLKLYQIFGFDNALKIIEDKFTYLTTAANIRISETNFRDSRREFRLQHQEKFYHYGIEDEILEALKEKDASYFERFCFNKNSWYALDFGNRIKTSIAGLPLPQQKETIKKIVIEEINQRESYYKEMDINNYLKYLQTKEINHPMTATELYQYFKNVDIPYELDSLGRVIPDFELNKFLLGNFKKDNDCLMRIIFNKECLGLNTMIHDIINKFDMFQNIVSKSNGKLSLNSILDIIDITKIKLYNLAPNEQDITLETLSKIINSKIYCSEEESVILKRVTELHVQRKKKVYSSIPTVSGEVNSTKYEVIPFDSDYSLSVGIDAGNCFKVGGKGEDLFRYCLLNPQAIILSLTDIDNNKYICPFIRSGNSIHGNGIDPIPEEKYLDDLLASIQDFSKKICSMSTIEIVTLTDLHIFDYMKEANYREYQLEQKIPLDDNLYSDYHKNEIKNYVIYQENQDSKSEYYLSDEKFYQNRNIKYQYSVNKEYDKERISLMLNSIAYSSIDFEKIPLKEKNKLKRKYSFLNIEEFQYIIGNKDWFIAIDGNLNIISYLLPYDVRARNEYLDSLANLPHKYLMEETNGIRR